MLRRTWSLWGTSLLLTTLAVPGLAQQEQPYPLVLAETADMEFELKKCELAVQMAEVGIKEATIVLEGIERKLKLARSANNEEQTESLELDRRQALVQVEMRKLAAEVTRVEWEQAKDRLGRREAIAGPASTIADSLRMEPTQSSNVLILRGEKDDVKKIVGLLEGAGAQKAEPAAGEETAAALERLLSQRRDTLQELVDFVELQYREGHAQLDAVVRASESLIDAQLDLAVDKPERIALRERRVENMKRLEELAKASRDVARVNNAEVLTATATRLKPSPPIVHSHARGRLPGSVKAF